jgi:hypothetical protein
MFEFVITRTSDLYLVGAYCYKYMNSHFICTLSTGEDKKLHRCLFKCYTMNAYGGLRAQLHVPGTFLMGKVSYIHCIGGWVGSHSWCGQEIQVM